MKDEDKPNKQLLKEVVELRQLIAEFKKSETKRKKTEKALQKANRALKKELKERKKAEKALRESEKMYKLLVKTCPDAVTLTDLKGHIIELSERKLELFGYKSAEELIGRNAFELIAPEDREKIMINFQKFFKEGFVRNLELTMIRKDGTRFIGEENAALIKNSYGKPKALMGITRDITWRKQAEEKLHQEVNSLRRQIQQSQKYPEIIGNSPKILQVIDLVHQVARTNSTILIFGETGSGKDLIAKAIHHNSPRRKSPFVIVNCAALPEHLIESELFGYVKGAFTGASQDKRGFFEEADKGTIFLNEIGDIPLPLQGKLLQVLEYQQIHRLGESKNIKVDVRIIAATNKDLRESMKKGRFREDLFYRLNVLPIKVPPLRERKEDIPFLVRHFLDKCCPPLNKEITEVSKEAMDMLCRYSYPGNVRELENIIQRSVIMVQGSILLPHHLPEELKAIKSTAAPQNLTESLAAIEKQQIEAALKECKGNLSRTAKKLGINRTTLWRRIKKFDIDISHYVHI